MRRQQAVIVILGVLWGTFSMGVHHARPHHPAVVATSTTSSTTHLVDRYSDTKVTRSEHRSAIQLHRVAASKVRTTQHHQIRSPRYVSAGATHLAGAEAWAASAHTRRLIQCESGGDPTVVSTHSGVTYYGLYQMDRDFWTTYGGDPSYLSSPFRAPVWLQNEVAYRGYLHRGYEPWACG